MISYFSTEEPVAAPLHLYQILIQYCEKVMERMRFSHEDEL
jgi:hypothetical protein